MSVELLTAPQERTSKGPILVPVVSVVAAPHQRELFSQSLVDDSAPDRQRRFWTRFWSSCTQAVILVVLIAIPLWFTDALPVQQLATFLVAPPPPPPPPPPAAPAVKI